MAKVANCYLSLIPVYTLIVFHHVCLPT